MSQNNKMKQPEINCSYDELRAAITLQPHPRNPNTHSDEQIKLLAKIIQHQGWRNPVVVSKLSGFIVAGHGRLKAAELLGLDEVPVDLQDFKTEADELAHLVADNRIAELSEINRVTLADIIADLDTGEIDLELTGFELPDLEELMTAEHPREGLTDDDEVPEPPEQPVTVEGDIWLLCDHRLMCGDSTSVDAVEKLMDGEKAEMLHADPPYGMGKESDGVLNDNLYKEQLDKFQMDWWLAFRPSLNENASVYIWGNSPDLWRLWYKGGLCDSEHLELRNQIVWDKKSIPGMKSPLMTQYPEASEHCLFFQIGEQFVNNVNKSDFPHEWLPLLEYLAGEASINNVDSKMVKTVCGCQMFSHWFTKSQFSLVSENNYKKLADHTGGFKRKWKDLKKEWDQVRSIPVQSLKRSYFNNSHDVMRDVWEFSRVVGEERHNHATPKPVDMMERVMKSSTPDKGVCIEPFGGSGSTLMGAEKTNRKCRMMELDPKYCDVIINRWQDFTGKEATHADTGKKFETH